MLEFDSEVSTKQIQEVEEREKVPIFVYYQWENTYVKERKVEIEEALDLLHRQPSETEYPSNHIGFMTKISKGCIQFVNEDNSKWWIDIPIYGDFGDKYDWTKEVFQAYENFELVLELVEEYFKQGALFNSIQTYEYDIFLKITTGMGIKWRGYFPNSNK